MNDVNILKKLIPEIFGFTPTPPQLAFLSSKGRKKLFRGANQIGKTLTGAMEAWCLAMGIHPFRLLNPRFSKPTSGLVICNDWKSYVDVISSKMFQLAPKAFISSNSQYTKDRGWGSKKIIELVNGSTIQFRTCGQDTTDIAGLTCDWLWLDEPPKREIYNEAMKRIMASHGPVFCTMTPIGRSVEYFKDLVESEDSDWEQYVATLCIENAPWMTQESIDEEIAGTDLNERPQRIYAEWEGVETDRKYYSYDITKHYLQKRTSKAILDNVTWRYGLGIDYGELAGRQTALLCAFDSTRCIFIDEYVSQKASSHEDDASAIKLMLDRNDLSVQDLTYIVGDINSAGKDYSGKKMNDVLGNLLGRQIHAANKRRVNEHVVSVNLLMQKEKLFILDSCPNVHKALSYWKDDNSTEQYKHCIDALHYIVGFISDKHFSGQKKSPITTIRRTL